MTKPIINANKALTYIVNLEKELSSNISSLRFSKASGLNGFAQRHLISRIVAVSSCIFSFALLLPKIGAGVLDLSVGLITSIRTKRWDPIIFSQDRKDIYFYSLNLSVNAILRLPIALIKPTFQIGKLPLPLHPITRMPHPILPADLKIDHQKVACKHLTEMTETELDKNWKLNDFFGSIRFINLDRSKDRLASIQRELAKIGLTEENYERHPACDGRATLDQSIYNRVISHDKGLSPGIPEEKLKLDRMHQGQAGCYMSHYTLIKEISQRYDEAQKNLAEIQKNPETTKEELNAAKAAVRKYSSVLILEDDDYFGTISPSDITVQDRKACYFSDKLTTKGVGTLLRRGLRDLPEDWDMMYFMALSYYPPLKTTSPYLAKLTKAVGLTAYAINAPMYPILLKQLNKIDDPQKRFQPVDDEIATLHASHKCFVMTPPIVAQPGEESEINSVAQTDRDKKKYWQSN